MIDLSSATKDALIDALEAAVTAAVAGDPLFDVDVHESWPEKGLQGKRCVLVLDFEGDERPATLRAGGGTRDDTFRVELAVAVWGRESSARVLRNGQAAPLVDAVKALVRAEGAAKPGGCFGVAGVRQPEVLSYRVREYVLEPGKRECDVHLTVQFIGRHLATR